MANDCGLLQLDHVARYEFATSRMHLRHPSWDGNQSYGADRNIYIIK